MPPNNNSLSKQQIAELASKIDLVQAWQDYRQRYTELAVRVLAVAALAIGASIALLAQLNSSDLDAISVLYACWTLLIAGVIMNLIPFFVDAEFNRTRVQKLYQFLVDVSSGTTPDSFPLPTRPLTVVDRIQILGVVSVLSGLGALFFFAATNLL